MRDLIQVIRAEHHKVMQVTDDLVTAVQEGGVLAERETRRAIDALVALESRHEATEARYLWPVVRDVLPEYAGLREEAQVQERRARRRLHTLHKSVGTPEAVALATLVAKEIVAHVGLEETNILPALGSALGRNDSVRLGRQFRQTSARAPTRPHPRTPAVPGILAVMAPVAARVDAVKNLLRIRG